MRLLLRSPNLFCAYSAKFAHSATMLLSFKVCLRSKNYRPSEIERLRKKVKLFNHDQLLLLILLILRNLKGSMLY